VDGAPTSFFGTKGTIFPNVENIRRDFISKLNYPTSVIFLKYYYSVQQSFLLFFNLCKVFPGFILGLAESLSGFFSQRFCLPKQNKKLYCNKHKLNR
jgi:hypothetical protein